MRITLVISSLGGGGAERAASNMANHWAARGRRVTLLTTSHGPHPDAYPLDARVERRDLGHRRDAYTLAPDPDSLRALSALADTLTPAERGDLIADLGLVAALRRALAATRPDAVVSFMDITNVRVLLAAHGLDLRVVVSERCDPYDNFLGAGRELLRARLYPRAHYVAVLTEEIRAHFYPTVGARARVVPNAVLPPVYTPDAATRADDGRQKILTAMGRLDYEKGFDLLVHAFAPLAAKHPDWNLRILGEGRLRGELEGLIRSLNLAGRVSLPGFTDRPADALRRSRLFVMPSRSEGFGNSLAEALACGLPAVAFDCPSGPRHIVRDGVDGLLVPHKNVPALTAALDRLMSDDALRRRLAARAPDVLERFHTDKIMAMWEQLICDREGNEAPAAGVAAGADKAVDKVEAAGKGDTAAGATGRAASLTERGR